MQWEDDYWFKDYAKPPRRGRSASSRRADAAARTRRINEFKKKLQAWESQYNMATPKFQQCKHMIKKFGGIVPFSIAIGVHPDIIIYDWLMVPRGRGGRKIKLSGVKTDGLIPFPQLGVAIMVARCWGVYLKPQDIWPEYVDHDGVTNINAKQEIMTWLKQLEPKANMRDFENTIANLVAAPE